MDTNLQQKIDQTVDYYKNLLIAQYRTKPKAKAEIDLLIRTLLSSGIFFEVQNGYDINTATGKQLDIIGKYVGVDRNYISTDLIPGSYFSLSSILQSSDDIYKGFDGDGKILDDSDVYGGMLLVDEDYRSLIKFKIILNNSNLSEAEIDNLLYQFFGNDVLATSSNNMNIFYFLSESLASIAKVAINKKMLPKPIGVKINAVIKKDNVLFALSNGLTADNNFMFRGFDGDGKILDDSDFYVNNY